MPKLRQVFAIAILKKAYKPLYNLYFHEFRPAFSDLARSLLIKYDGFVKIYALDEVLTK